MAEQMAIAERFARLAMILGAAQYNENGIAAISRELVGEIRLALKGARTEIDAKDKRIAELEQLAALSPIKVGDISITLGLTETGEARMTFDGADDATLAVVAGKFALAMQATMDGAEGKAVKHG